jgi:signal-transduction protein with cAMP-binding, CBS, and nucleotidyltransferase domain
MTLEEIAETDVVTVEPGATADAVAGTLRDEDVGSAVVADGGEPVGVVTDRDLAVRVLAEGRTPGDVTAEDVMTRDPVTVEMGAGVFEVTRAMRDATARRMPVVEGGDLAGIVTLDDVVSLLVREFDNLAEVVEAESPRY